MINDNFYRRKYLIGGIAVVVVLTYIIRLFLLQVIDQSTKEKAENALYYQHLKNAVTVAPYMQEYENTLTLCRDMGVLKCIN